MKDMLCFVLKIFQTVTTCIVCILGTLSLFSEPGNITTGFLFQIMLVAALTSLPSLLYFVYKIPMAIRFAIHYVIVLAIVFSAGYLFEWFAFNVFGDFLALWLEITAIYAVAFIVGYTSRKKKSEELNRALGLRNEKKG